MAATKTNDQRLDLTEKDSPISKAVPVEPSKTDASPTHLGADGKGKGEALSESTDQEPREVEQGRDQDDPPAEPPSEQLQGAQTPGEDYSVLTVTQKKLIITVASLASLFSPMATAIYCQYPTFGNYAARINSIDPSLDTISKDLGVSNTKINITITLFLVCSALLPTRYMG
jgi:hypothetical protein